MTRNQLAAIAAGVAVVIAGVVAALLLQPPPPAPVTPLAVATPRPAATPDYSLPASVNHVNGDSPAPSVPAHVAPPLQIGAAPAWEANIDQILRSNQDEAQMARMLINLLPTLPEDGQIEAANHITNLLPDSNYAEVKPLLLNASLPESVLTVFFTDLMNRDDSTKLNAFLEIAQNPVHPMHEEAASDLQIYVGEDYGTDWAKWGDAVKQYLKTTANQ